MRAVVARIVLCAASLALWPASAAEASGDALLRGVAVDQVVFGIEGLATANGVLRGDAVKLTGTIVNDKETVAKFVRSLGTVKLADTMPPALGVLSFQVFLDRQGRVLAVVDVECSGV
jgi:hypothetical protein